MTSTYSAQFKGYFFLHILQIYRRFPIRSRIFSGLVIASEKLNTKAGTSVDSKHSKQEDKKETSRNSTLKAGVNKVNKSEPGKWNSPTTYTLSRYCLNLRLTAYIVLRSEISQQIVRTNKFVAQIG